MEAVNDESETPGTLPRQIHDGTAAELAEDHAVLQLGCGDDQNSEWLNTDISPDCNPDYCLDITEPWPDSWTNQFDRIVANHVLEHIPHMSPNEGTATVMNHVFPEASRVLRPGGEFVVRVPVGNNARTDPTHQSNWEWRTPLFYGDESRHWVPDHGFTLTDRELDVWMIAEMAPFNLLVQPLSQRWPNEFWYELPGTAGEITARYRRREE